MANHLAAAAILLMMTGFVAAADKPAADPGASSPNASSMQADAMKLCERLAGTEREICVHQAHENERMTDPRGVGATPGTPGTPPGQVPLPQPGGGERNR